MPCVILAGGQSRRFGSNKALVSFQGQRLIDHVIQRLEAQTSGPIAINTSTETGFKDISYPVITDQLSGGVGPLAGLHAGMVWAHQQGFETVISTPVDTPMLPLDFIEHLRMAGEPSIALCNARPHVVHGLWPTRLVTPLRRALDRGMRAVRDWATECQAVHCEFHAESGWDPFFNVNTVEDLKALEQAQPVSVNPAIHP